MSPNPPKLDKVVESIKEVLIPKSDPPELIKPPEPVIVEEPAKPLESKPEGY